MPHQDDDDDLNDFWRQARELIFLASIGDVERMEALVHTHRADVRLEEQLFVYVS